MIASFYNIEPDSSHVRESQYSIKKMLMFVNEIMKINRPVHLTMY